MKQKSNRASWYKILAPAIIGPLAAVALIVIVSIIVLTPANAVGTVSLPDEIKPVAIDFGALTPTTVAPTATPAPTATIQPTPAPTLALQPTFAPTPTATPTIMPSPTPLPPLPGIVPQRLRIPSVGINAFVEQVGLDSQNRMDVPRNIWNVAWFKLGAKPGERGNAVIDGHVDGPNTAAVFWTMRNLQIGGKIYVQDAKGQEKVFEVFDTGVYPYDQAPLDRIFGPSNDAQLNLITCTGTFDHATDNYDKRFVAYARLVPNGTA